MRTAHPYIPIPPHTHPTPIPVVQKAQEARVRTAQLRQSIQKGSEGREAAALARAAVDSPTPPHTHMRPGSSATVGASAASSPAAGGAEAEDAVMMDMDVEMVSPPPPLLAGGGGVERVRSPRPSPRQQQQYIVHQQQQQYDSRPRTGSPRQVSPRQGGLLSPARTGRSQLGVDGSVNQHQLSSPARRPLQMSGGDNGSPARWR